MNRMAYKAYCDKMDKAGRKPMSEEAYSAMSDTEYREMDKALSISGDPAVAQGDPVDAVASDDPAGDPPSMIKARAAGAELLKAVQAYKNVEQVLDPAETMQKSLEAKVAAGTISRDERLQLARIYQGEQAAAQPLRKSLAEHVRDHASPDAEALVDASEALDALIKGISARLDRFEDHSHRDSLSNRELVKAQGALLQGVGGAIHSITEALGELHKSIGALNGRVSTVEAAPVSPRAVNPNVRIVKSGHQEPGAANSQKMSKAQIKQGLRALSVQAIQSGDQNRIAKAQAAAALFDAAGQVSPETAASLRSLNA